MAGVGVEVGYFKQERMDIMNEIRIALVGFGSVNRALVRMLLDKSEPGPPEEEKGRKRRRYLRIVKREAKLRRVLQVKK